MESNHLILLIIAIVLCIINLILSGLSLVKSGTTKSNYKNMKKRHPRSNRR